MAGEFVVKNGLISKGDATILGTLSATTIRVTENIIGGNVISGSGTTGRIPYFNSTSGVTTTSAFTWDNSNVRLGIGLTGPTASLEVANSANNVPFRFTTDSNNYVEFKHGTGVSNNLTINNYKSGAFKSSLSLGDTFSLAYAGSGESSIYNSAQTSAGLGLRLNIRNRFGINYSPNSYDSMLTIKGNLEVANANILTLLTSSDVNALSVFYNGNVSINGATDAGYKLDVNGTVRASGVLTVDTSTNYALRLINNTIIAGHNGGGGTEINMANNSAYRAYGNLYVGTLQSGTFYLGNNNTNAMAIVYGNNIIIQSGGTYTDGGYRLDINGTGASTGALRVTNGSTVLQGGGSTSATTALTVQNSSSTNLFRVLNDGTNLFGAFAENPRIYPGNSLGTLDANGASLIFDIINTGSGRIIFKGGNQTVTSGQYAMMELIRTFAPTSGTSTYVHLGIYPTINQTGGASGLTRGLYVQPTITSAADWRSIEWSNNTGWGLYGAGTASSYLNGNLLLGTTTDSGYKLDVNGAARMITSLRVGTSYSGGTNDSSTNNFTHNAGLGTVSFVRFDSYAAANFVTITQPLYGTPANGSQLYVSANSSKSAGFALIKAVGVASAGDGSTFIFAGNSQSVTSGLQSIAKLEFNFGDGYLGPNYSLNRYAALDIKISARTANYAAPSSTNIVGVYLQNNFLNQYSSSYLPAESWKAIDDASTFSYMVTPYTGVHIRPTFSNVFNSANHYGIDVTPTLNGMTSWTAVRWNNNAGWGLYGSGTSLNYLAGNLLLATTTDAGYKLDVSGSTRIIGTGSTSATNALVIQNSSGTNKYTFDNGGLFWSNSGIMVGANSANGIKISASADNHLNLRFSSAYNAFGVYGQNIENSIYLFTYPTAVNTESTTNSLWGITHTFAPTSGSSSYILAGLKPTINQTGGASGVTRGLYVNPILTAAADWRSVEWSNNTGWGLYGAGTASNYFGGNVLIGIGTSAGYKLDVNGNSRLKGSDATSSNYALTVQNSAGSTMFTVRNDGAVNAGNLIVSGTTVMGPGALAGGGGSIAFGTNATVFGNAHAAAIGYDAQSSNAHAIAIGYSSRASGNPSIALGFAASAGGSYSTAFSNASASGNNSIAGGNGSVAISSSSVALGAGSYSYLTGQIATSGGYLSYRGDSQYSIVVLPLNTGNVDSGGVYSFSGVRPNNGTFGSGVSQIWLLQARIVFAVRGKSTTVTEFNTQDFYTAIYQFAVTSNLNSGTSIVGTPALVNTFSHPTMSGCSVNFSIVSNQLVTSITPPTWATGQVQFRGTVSYELTELGIYPQTI